MRIIIEFDETAKPVIYEQSNAIEKNSEGLIRPTGASDAGSAPAQAKVQTASLMESATAENPNITTFDRSIATSGGASPGYQENE